MLNSLSASPVGGRDVFAFAALGFLLFIRYGPQAVSVGFAEGREPPIFGKEQIPVLLKKQKSASEFFGIVSSYAGRA